MIENHKDYNQKLKCIIWSIKRQIDNHIMPKNWDRNISTAKIFLREDKNNNIKIKCNISEKNKPSGVKCTHSFEIDNIKINSIKDIDKKKDKIIDEAIKRIEYQI